MLQLNNKQLNEIIKKPLQLNEETLKNVKGLVKSKLELKLLNSGYKLVSIHLDGEEVYKVFSRGKNKRRSWIKIPCGW